MLHQHLQGPRLVPNLDLDHVVGLAVVAVHVTLEHLDPTDSCGQVVWPLVDRLHLTLSVEELSRVAVGQPGSLPERPIWVYQVCQALRSLGLDPRQVPTMLWADKSAINRIPTTGLLSPVLGGTAAPFMLGGFHACGILTTVYDYVTVLLSSEPSLGGLGGHGEPSPGSHPSLLPHFIPIAKMFSV